MASGPTWKVVVLLQCLGMLQFVLQCSTCSYSTTSSPYKSLPQLEEIWNSRPTNANTLQFLHSVPLDEYEDWDLGFPGYIDIPDGAQSISCVYLANAQLSLPSTTSFGAPSAFQLSGQTVLELNHVIMSTSCSDLYMYISYVCSSFPGGIVQIAETWLYVESWWSTSMHLLNVNITCDANTTDVDLAPPACVFVPVSSAYDILAACEVAQVPGTGLVMAAIRNISFQGVVWPAQACEVVTNWTITSVNNTLTAIDLGLMTDLFNITSSVVTLQGLTLVNLATEYFPPSHYHSCFGLLTQRVWAWSRINKQLTVRNVTMVLPPDEFQYMQYWITLILSPVPDIASKAAWLQLYEIQVDSKFKAGIFIMYMASFTVEYSNIIFTNKSMVFPSNSYSTGVTSVFTDSYLPVVDITPVNSGPDLLVALDVLGYNTDGYTAVILLVSSISLGGDVWPKHGATLYGPINIVGRPGRDIIVDCNASTQLLVLAPTASLTLGRVVILNPTVLTTSVTSATHISEVLTSSLWIFDITKSQQEMVLSNVTVVISQEELDILSAALVPSAATNTTSVVRAALISSIQSFFTRQFLITANSSFLLFETLSCSRYIASNIAFTSVYNGSQKIGGVNFSSLPNLTPAVSPSLPPWEVPIAVVCSSSVAILLAAAAVVCLKRRRRRQQHVELLTKKAQAVALANRANMDDATAYPPQHTSQTISAESLSQSQSGIGSLDHVHVVVPSGSGPRDRGTSNSTLFVTPNISSAGFRGDSFEQPPSGMYCSGINAEVEAISAQLSGRPRDPPEQLHRLVTSLSSAIQDRQISIHEMLGSGAYGVVYKGMWRGLPVAIKTLFFHGSSSKSNSHHQRGLMEAAISANLSNPYIVTTYAYEIKPLHALEEFGYQQTPLFCPPPADSGSGWRLCIVQEFCDGGTLTAAIDSHMFRDEVQDDAKLLVVLEAAEGIAAGMEHIHSKNIIHGDLNPNNVLLKLCPETQLGSIVKVADFGLSVKMTEEQSHISNLCQGTPNYVAPEVLKNGRLSKAADVFSFGVVLWELYNGTPPWRRQRMAGYPPADLATLLGFPPTCPPEYASLTRQCLSVDETGRPAFDEILTMLQRMKYALMG